MSFFTSPLKLVNVLTSVKKINEEIKPKDVKWFLSSEGAKSYKAATTIAQKTELVYLCMHAYNKDVDKDMAQKLAWVIAVAADGTSKPYGQWPGIFDTSVNPLLKFAVQTRFVSSLDLIRFSKDHDCDYMDLADANRNDIIAKAIAAAQESNNAGKLYYGCKKPYLYLTKYEDDPELFFIERCIIFAIDSGSTVLEGIGPYSFGGLEEAEEEDDNE